MKSHKILLVTPYFPPHFGGVEQYVYNLGLRLQEQLGERVVVATTGGTSCGVCCGEVDGLLVYQLPVVGKLSNTPVGVGWLRALRRVIATENIELVSAYAPVPVLADVAARASGDLPFVLTYLAGPMQKGQFWPDLLISLYQRAILPQTAARADRIICSSDWVRSSFANLFGARAITISPGVEVGIFRPGGRARPDRLLFVASLDRATRYKGLDDLLQAVRFLSASRPTVRLVVVGEGDSRGEYERRSREMGLGDLVHFTGALDLTELVAAYQHAAVVVLPTRFDSFPTVIAEAMACGRPVVSTTVGGVPTLVSDEVNGLLVPPADIASLASALERVLRDEALARQLGAAARERVVSGLSWEAQAERTAAVFEEARELRRTRRRRTVAVVTSYYPPTIGGVEHYARRVANAVHAAPDLDIIVVASNHEGRRTVAELVDDVPVIRLGTWFKLSNTPISPLWPFQLWRIFRRERVGLVNAHSPVPYMADVAIAVARGIPVAMTYHSGPLAKGIPWLDVLLGFYERRVLERLFRRAAAIIAVSPASTAYGHEGASLIPPGVDTLVFTPGPLATGAPEGQEILYVGRLDRSSPLKGIGVLLDAFAQVAPSLPETRLVFVGGGDAEPDHHSRAARLGVADRVVFRGVLRDAELVDAYRRAAVVVLPSLTEAESFGMPLLEAMSCGRPVVGSRVGGIPSLVTDGDDGLLVPPGDSRSLANALVEILQDPELAARLGANGRRRASGYDWSEQMKRTLELFRAVLATGGSAEVASSPGVARRQADGPAGSDAAVARSGSRLG
jgi:glycosyltransferase involved in cell wall biosynthesis